MKQLKLTFLGTGTSQGVPVIGCDCECCRSEDPRDKRLRSSVLIETAGLSIVIDAGPDFRQQMLRARVKRLDAVLLTHAHKDHTGGLDDVRAFNYIQKGAVDVYGRSDVLQALRVEFGYAFDEVRYPGVPEINLIEVELKPFNIGWLEIIPIEVMHHKLKIFAYRIGPIVYVTDASSISESEMLKMMGCEVLIINALRHRLHYSHFNLEQALAVIEEISPGRAYLTHISHMMGVTSDLEPTLPAGVSLAHDGLDLYVDL
jgi:phosphoribosyl 1,2-cyclic phosphate phosphodiesterase